MWRRNFLVVAALVLVFVLGNPSSATLLAGVPQSLNVAVIDSLDVINGGTFPTATSGPTGSFTDFKFYRFRLLM